MSWCMRMTTVRGLFEYDQTILEKLKAAQKFYLDFADDEDDSIELQTSIGSHLPARTDRSSGTILRAIASMSAAV